MSHHCHNKKTKQNGCGTGPLTEESLLERKSLIKPHRGSHNCPSEAQDEVCGTGNRRTYLCSKRDESFTLLPLAT